MNQRVPVRITIAIIFFSCLPHELLGQCQDALVALREDRIPGFSNLDGCPGELTTDSDLIHEIERLLRGSLQDRNAEKLKEIASFLAEMHATYSDQNAKNHKSVSIRRSIIGMLKDGDLGALLRQYRFVQPEDESKRSYDEALRSLTQIAETFSEGSNPRPALQAPLDAASADSIAALRREMEDLRTQVDQSESRLRRELDEDLATGLEKLARNPSLRMNDNLARNAAILAFVSAVVLSFFVFTRVRYLSGEQVATNQKLTQFTDAIGRLQRAGLKVDTAVPVLSTLDEFIRKETSGSIPTFEELVKCVRILDKRLAYLYEQMKSLQAAVERVGSEKERSGRSPADSVGMVEVERSLEALAQRTSVDLGDLSSRLCRLENLESARKEGNLKTFDTGSDLIVTLRDVEMEVLRHGWQRYSEANKETLLDLGSRKEEWSEVRDQLMINLPKLVAGQARLAPSCEGVLAPVRDYDNISSRILLIDKLLSGELPPIESAVRDYLRIRDYTGLLSVLQSSERASERLRFDSRGWAKGQFRNFADLFFRYYQEAEVSGSVAALEDARRIVAEVLKWAGVEVMEIRLGKTAFNSREHIGRSTMNRPEYPDGVVIGVIKTGFREIGGNILQQPEVVVNRR